MKLSKFIETVGDQNVTFQDVAQSAINWNTNKNGVTKITFETDAMTAQDSMQAEPPKIGWIVWMKRADYDRAVKEMKK